jgi:hypothetical protein
MESLIGTIVALLQIALAGFVMWGGWLVLRDWFRRQRADAAAADEVATPSPQQQANDFERVASLVLLALLCTTLAAAA